MEPLRQLWCKNSKDDQVEAAAESVDAAEQVAVTRVLTGDLDAYAELVRRHAAAAHRAAMLFGAGSDAEDVVQVAFVKAYEALPRFRDGAAFRPWLLRIVVNEAKNAARAQHRGRRALNRLAILDGQLFAPDPAAATISDEDRRELIRAVRQLSRSQQNVVACRYFLELNEQETARVLGLPRGTVKSRLSRALRRLREQLDDVEVDDEQ